MSSKKMCRLAQDGVVPSLQLMPRPGSSRDLVQYLQLAACLGAADPKLVSHLTEMGALFPEELAGAYKAFRRKRASEN
jgi:hypothetical protein